jgi:hypothetical protein
MTKPKHKSKRKSVKRARRGSKRVIKVVDSSGMRDCVWDWLDAIIWRGRWL